MIHRLVKMVFKPQYSEAFIRHEKSVHNHIVAFQGCHSLRVLQDKQNENMFFSYSLWESHEALEAYRHSDFFRQTWAKIKPWFAARAEAYSTQTIV